MSTPNPSRPIPVKELIEQYNRELMETYRQQSQPHKNSERPAATDSNSGTRERLSASRLCPTASRDRNSTAARHTSLACLSIYRC